MGYSSLCVQPADKHYCAACPEDIVTELAGIGTAGKISEAYYPILIASPTTKQLWVTGIASGDIIILPFTRGSYEPGDPKELPGYGRSKVSYGARTSTISLTERFDKRNYAFFNNLHKRNDLHDFVVTSSLVHIFDVVGITTAKDPIPDDVEAVLEWATVTKITHENLPTKHDISAFKEVFDCVPVTPPSGFTFSAQPIGKVIALGEAASLSGAATANGTGTVTYKWQKKFSNTYADVVNSGGSQNTNTASGMATVVLAFSAATANVNGANIFDEGTFRLKATDSAATPVVIYSNDVTLSVLNSKFTFVSNQQSDSGDDGGSGSTGVGMNAGGTNATKKFAFDKATDLTGTPGTMLIKVGGTTPSNNVLNVTFPTGTNGYSGKAFRYTHTDGTQYFGVFTAGDVVF